MKFTAGDLDYKGEESGVHNWITKQGKSFYWHPDWLHIAEDQTGMHVKQQLEVAENQKGTKDHAVLAILKHLNDWMVDEIDKHPDVKNQPKL